ncbi:hypothetical protein BGX31_001476 [Mortierella sp. GBA43]|nr:hypothetical protein BGX31_001476 [Mortierella sp. GBA43]
MRENTEMHLISKIQLDTFPMFLLMPGCKEPCRIFTSPENKASAQFLSELFRRDDIDDMKSRSLAENGPAIGEIGWLLRVATKSGTSSKRKVMHSGNANSGSSRQDDNPFLLSTTTEGPFTAARSSADTIETGEDIRRKLYQETTMFLVYGQLSDRGKLNRKTGKRDPPTVCFFAHPLVDQASFSEQILLNSRTMEALGHGPDDDDIQPDIDHDNHIQYKDPAVDAIMNGSDDHVNDDGQESGYGSDWIPPFDIKEDDGNYTNTI